MFERFTDRGRVVLIRAQDEARALQHGYIGTEHILLGCLSEGSGIAAQVLVELGLPLDRVRDEVEAIIGRGDTSPVGHIPYTPRVKKALELSLREALQLGHNWIGTEHILLGLIREGEGVAAQVMVKLGADMSVTRAAVIQVLSGYRSSIPPPAERSQSLVSFLDDLRSRAERFGTERNEELRELVRLAELVDPGLGLNPADVPRRFFLRRDVDETGVSGTGVVAFGICFEDGTVVIRWMTDHRSTTTFSSMRDLVAIHGHGGRTEPVWID